MGIFKKIIERVYPSPKDTCQIIAEHYQGGNILYYPMIYSQNGLDCTHIDGDREKGWFYLSVVLKRVYLYRYTKCECLSYKEAQENINTYKKWLRDNGKQVVSVSILPCDVNDDGEVS